MSPSVLDLHAGHALRIGAPDEGAGHLGAEGRCQRGFEILLVDQPHLDVGGRRRSDARLRCRLGTLRGVFLEDAFHRRRAIDAAAGDHGGADGMIEAADAARRRADAQIGAEGERQKPRISSAVEKRVYCAGAPANAPGGGGCLPDAARAGAAHAATSSVALIPTQTGIHNARINPRSASSARRINPNSLVRAAARTRPSCATEATSVPSRANISPRAKPREPCRLGVSCA